jgi:hypothetical protein
MVIDHFVETYGMSPEDLADGIFYARIDADWLVGFAMTAEEEVEIERARQEREARRAAAARDTAARDTATADPATADPAAAGAAPG